MTTPDKRGGPSVTGRRPAVVLATPRRSLLLVVALAAALASAGIATIPFYTRGEPREALVVQEMVRGEGLVLPLRKGELPRKPPFFHWLAAGISAAAGRVDEVTVRLPSALASVVAAVFIFFWASSIGGPTTGLLTAAVTITSFEWMRAATLARVDMVYAACLVMALVSLDRLLRGAPREALWRRLFYGAIAAAVLTKGPVALVFVAMTAIPLAAVSAAPGVLGRLSPVSGIAAVLAIVGTWFALAYQQHGDAFLRVFVRENLYHLVATDEGGTGHEHGNSYLFAVTMLGLLPWTPTLPLIVTAVRRRVRDPGVLLALVWVVVVIGVHMLASAKRGVYLLPAYPALALLVVTGATVADRAWARSFLPFIARIYAAFGLCFAAIMVALSWGWETPYAIQSLLRPRDRIGLEAATAAATENVLFLTVAAAAVAVAVPFLIRAARKNRWAELIGSIAIIAGSAAVIFNSAIHPAVARRRSLKEFMVAVNTVVRPDQPLLFLGSADPGAVFYADRPINSIARHEARSASAHLLIWERDWLELGAGGRLPPPLKVSQTKSARRGHLLLLAGVAAPASDQTDEAQNIPLSGPPRTP